MKCGDPILIHFYILPDNYVYQPQCRFCYHIQPMRTDGTLTEDFGEHHAPDCIHPDNKKSKNIDNTATNSVNSTVTPHG